MKIEDILIELLRGSSATYMYFLASFKNISGIYLSLNVISMLLSPLIQLECYYPAQVACIKKSRELLINKNTVKNNRCYAYIYTLSSAFIKVNKLQKLKNFL